MAYGYLYKFPVLFYRTPSMIEDFDVPFGYKKAPPTPEGEEEHLWHYRARIRERCRLPKHPPHTLTPEVADGIRFIRHDIAALLPEEFTRDDMFSLFLQRENPFGSYYMLDEYGEVRYDREKEEAAMRSSPYLPGYYDIDGEELIASYQRSLDADKNLNPGYVDFPAKDRVRLQLGVRRTPKPDPVTIVEGVYYHQFTSDEWHSEHAAPQLFAAIEKNLEDHTTDDPFEWVRDRASIAAGYSVLGGGKDCSPLFLADVYERMASTACNTTPVGHGQPIDYEIGPEEEDLLIELYGRYADSVCPEMVMLVLEHAHVLTPQILRESESIRLFLSHLPEMLENGLNIDRVDEFTRAPTRETGTLLERLESGLRIATSIYCGQKPWWFKENFDMSEWFLENDQEDRDGRLSIRNDSAGRATMERLAAKAGFAFRHVMEPYVAIGYRMTGIAPFTEDEAIDFTAFVTNHYGVGNARRGIEVLQHCFHVLEQEEQSRRPDRLKHLREHLDDVAPQTLTIGRLEARAPVFEMPGVHQLTATMLGKQLAQSGDVHNLRIGFDVLQAIDDKFKEPLAERARTYAPALPDHLLDMERRGLLVSQSSEARLVLPVAQEHLTIDPKGNSILGIFDLYAQIKEECGEVDRRTTALYFQFCAARMPDPWHPPKGFLKFLQLFERIETPGWRFSALEHPRDRQKVEEENDRRTTAKKMLVSNMLDAWIMGLLTGDELEALFAWLTAELKPEERIAVHKDVLWNKWHERLWRMDNPPPRDELDDDIVDEYGGYIHSNGNWSSAPEGTPEERRQQAMEELDRDIAMACDLREQSIRSTRMVALQQSFTMLSVLNSMSIAGSFDHQELRSVLRQAILPGELRPGDGNTNQENDAMKKGHMLANLVRLQELGGIDHEALREAVQSSETPAQAWATAQAFIDTVLVRCMQESIGSSVPAAIERVTRLMEIHAGGDPTSAQLELRQAVAQIRWQLEGELRAIWDGAPFVAADIVDRVLREFRIPQYVELFDPIRQFNAHALPKYLPEPSGNPRHGDLYDSNAHSARMFQFIGSRILQEHAHANGDGALATLEQRYGASSNVNMSGGTALVRRLAIHPDNDHALGDPASMYQQLAEHLPDFQKYVDQWRLADVPLGPIGGRWHFGNPVSDKHLELFKHLLSLGQTPFRMIHSNTSLIVPGFMSKNEMRMFILMLALEGLIDPAKAELQLGVTSRLSPQLCAYFGSSCMLGTAQCPPFKIDSFVPSRPDNHYLTAARIVAYDAYPESAGTRRNFELPFMFQGSPESGKNVGGRTDILGRWNVRWNLGTAKPDLYTMDDLDITHTVGATLRHVQYGGPLKDAGLTYMKRHREILGDYGLTDTLDAPWVYDREHEAYEDASMNPEHFNRCVKACMDVHFAHASGFAQRKGAVFDVRENIDMLIRQAETIGVQVLKDPAYESDVRALLQATSYESLLS